MMFGTNDSKPFNWNKDNFMKDYANLAKSYMNVLKPVDIYLLVPPPVYMDINGYAID